ncbi:MAG: ATP-grasp domain-containing protein [Ignavibacteria bacterium]|nr:ATP-grasp domain-containing protein [Ignavibacteria bacterium]
MKEDIKILLVYNQPVGGIFESYDGRRIKSESSNSIDLSEVGVLEEYEEIKEALTERGYKTESFNLLDNISELCSKVGAGNYDVVFNLVESVGGESIKEMYVAGIYELYNIPYTGCSAVTLGLCLNKHRAKLLMKGAGFNVPDWKLYANPSKIIFDSKPEFPMIVKPSQEDASVGISEQSVVYNENELKEQLEFIYNTLKQPVLVEEYIEGREINSAILGDKEKVALPLSEISFDTLPDDLPKIVTYDGKWIKDSLYCQNTIPVCPAPLDDELAEHIKRIALDVSNLFGCRDYCRVDFRIDKNNKPYILEVNPNPDISKDAGFARAAKAYGLDYDELLIRIIEFALERRK